MERKITKEAIETERKKYSAGQNSPANIVKNQCINAIYGKRAMLDKKARNNYNSKMVGGIIKMAKIYQKKNQHLIMTSPTIYTDTDSVIIKSRIEVGEIIESLQGTCDSLDSVCESLYGISEDSLKQKQIEEIDNEIFCCTKCGWWCEQPAEDLNDEQVCENCYEEKDERK